MTPERKRLSHDLLSAVAVRLNIIDEMLNGQRPPNDVDAKRYMKEVKNHLEKINNMIDIG